jgi:hypothetical protein
MYLREKSGNLGGRLPGKKRLESFAAIFFISKLCKILSLAINLNCRPRENSFLTLSKKMKYFFKWQYLPSFDEVRIFYEPG